MYAIGDIHGRDDLLAALHALILKDARTALHREKVVIYLGDYVDRGPDSAGVIARVIADRLPGFTAVPLCGNHEDMMVQFLATPTSGLWLANGGTATLASYGIRAPFFADDPELLVALGQALDDGLPIRHRLFLDNLSLCHREGDYLFVHAGIRPGVPIERQNPREILWIRDLFLDFDGDFGCRVVHGHSITRRPDVRWNRIGVDTGAVYSNRLTCLVLDDGDVRFLET